uniref:Neprosin PEP catalytic domain-containing protein n=1 Tax=Chenopodium quinoa TaxID=63459 RepID=A0A803M0K6_CHEQI
MSDLKGLNRHCRKEINLSDEDLELETRLKTLNKPPILSFQKEDGSIIDCIDIYKQPAFDHPKLKNHRIQVHKLPSKVTQCPPGTVPIRRTRKEDLVTANAVLSHYRTMTGGPPFTPSQGNYYAGAGTPNGTSEKYLGARAAIALFNLTIAIPAQTSAASLRIGSGVDGPFNNIEYGYTADGFGKTGCFNMLCPGFVQVNQLRHMGDELTYFSEYDKSTRFMLLGIIKDPKTQNWWIVESLPEATNQYIGYWPKELLPEMSDSATNVQVGGKVYNPSIEPSKTPMGSGHFVADDLLKTCQAIVHVVNSTYGLIPDESLKMDVFANSPDLYNAQFLDGAEVLFGGPDFTT